ncbi:hypothetical protein F5880DRAFT_393522 [Lentinula raphanica]|nr:hypothetical protein F5880DRAFT_393522 [Lentinula raphanica]
MIRRSHSALLLAALGVASIAAAAPLPRIVLSSVKIPGEDAASCALFNQDTHQSGNPQPRSESEPNVFPNNVLDTVDSSSFDHDSSVIVSTSSSSPVSRSLLQENADTASIPSIEYRSPCILSGDDSTRVFSPDPPYATVTRSLPLPRKHADTDIDPVIQSRAPQSSDPLVVEHPIDVSSPSIAYTPVARSFPPKRMDTDTASGDHIIESRNVHPSSGPLIHPTSGSSATPHDGTEAADPDIDDIQRKIDAIIAANSPAQAVVSHNSSAFSTTPPNRIAFPHADLTDAQRKIDSAIAAADPFAYAIVSQIPELSTAYDVCEMLKFALEFQSKPWPVEPMARITNWDQFVQTAAGKLWRDTDQLISIMRPDDHGGHSIRTEITVQIILAHPDNGFTNKGVYKSLTEWNHPRYWEDTKAAKGGGLSKFYSTETGRIFLRIRDYIEPPSTIHLNYNALSTLVSEDIQGYSVDEKAERRMSQIIGDSDAVASIRAARDLVDFIDRKSFCSRRYSTRVNVAPPNVATVLRQMMVEFIRNPNRAQEFMKTGKVTDGSSAAQRTSKN